MKRALVPVSILLVGGLIGLLGSGPVANAAAQYFTDPSGDTGDPYFDFVTYWHDADLETFELVHGVSLAQAPSNPEWDDMYHQFEFLFDADNDPQGLFETSITPRFDAGSVTGVVERGGEVVGEVALERPDDRSLVFRLPPEMLGDPTGTGSYKWMVHVARGWAKPTSCSTQTPSPSSSTGSPSPAPIPACPDHEDRYDQDHTEIVIHDVDMRYMPKNVPTQIRGHFVDSGGLRGRLLGTSPCLAGRTVVVKAEGRVLARVKTNGRHVWRTGSIKPIRTVVAKVRASEIQIGSGIFYCFSDRVRISRP